MEIMATPNSAGAIGNVLTSVSCASTCAAAGYAYTPGPNGFPLPPVPTALVERSGQWVLRNVGIPPGTGGTALYGVSWDGRRATAAGYQFATSGLQVTFAATGR